MKRLILCALLAGCGGLPLPHPDATRCAHNVYVERGLSYSCSDAVAVYDNVKRETGVDMDDGLRVVEFVHGPTLADLGQPNAIGLCSDNDIAVVWQYASALYHEVLHLDDHSHCNWSVKYLPLFERNKVSGAFTDDCQHVRCSTTREWVSNGQILGDTYVCTPLDK